MRPEAAWRRDLGANGRTEMKVHRENVRTKPTDRYRAKVRLDGLLDVLEDSGRIWSPRLSMQIDAAVVELEELVETTHDDP